MAEVIGWAVIWGSLGLFVLVVVGGIAGGIRAMTFHGRSKRALKRDMQHLEDAEKGEEK